MKKKLFILLMISTIIFAQSNNSIDTSYTIKSTYNKLIKKYPFITVAQSESNIAITEIKEVIYHGNKERALHLDAFFFKKEKRIRQ